MTVRDRREIAVVRRRVRDACRRLSNDEAWLDAIVLTVSEVVTNAIEYGSDGTVEISVDVDDHTVRIEVSADSTGIPLPPTGPVPTTSVRGRGLQVVHALADQVSIDIRGGRVTVVCRFDVPG
jgi:anti-sigma regulatory factor (Ser/Thr protein kinase)